MVAIDADTRGAERCPANNVLVVIVDNLRVGGVQSYLSSRLPKLIRSCGCKITLLVPGTVKNAKIAESLEAAGVRIVECGVDMTSEIAKRTRLKAAMRRAMATGDYDVIHINSGNRFLEYTALSAAKEAGIPVRVAHSHTANFTHGPLVKAIGAFYRMRINGLATDYLACSDAAGVFLFGKRKWESCGKLVPNGIDLAKYRPSPEVRQAIRKSCSCKPGARVYGFVGRFVPVKNTAFLIEVFIALSRLDGEAAFWLVGDGPDLAKAREDAERAGIGGRTVFFGARDDVPDILQGIDALLLPSTFEGFPLVSLEAQAAGIPCFVSDVVPQGAHISGCEMTYISLERTADEWASIINSSQPDRNERGVDFVQEAGYDLESSLKVLYPYYLGSAGRKE